MVNVVSIRSIKSKIKSVIVCHILAGNANWYFIQAKDLNFMCLENTQNPFLVDWIIFPK